MQSKKKCSHLYESILSGEMLFQKSITPMMIVDSSRTIVKANHRFCELFGYTLDEITGKQTIILTPSKEHFEEYGKAFEKARDGSIESSELLYKKSNGTLFWVKLTGIPLDTEAGHFVLWSFDDITKEVNARENLKRSHKELEVIFDLTKFGLMYVVNGIIQKVNRSLLSMTDKDQSIIGRNVTTILKRFYLCKDQNHKTIKQFQKQNGDTILTECEIAKIDDDCYLIIFSDITVHIKEKESLTKLAETDGLTQVYNRRAFTNIAQHMVTGSQHEFTSFAMLDIDFFKQINDTLGHDIGDAVLIELAALMKKLLGNNEIIGRLGGEEFGILLPLSIEDAAVTCEHIRQAVLENTFTEKKLKITISIGLVDNTSANILDFEAMYKAADRNLYDAKNMGRNRLIY